MRFTVRDFVVVVNHRVSALDTELAEHEIVGDFLFGDQPEVRDVSPHLFFKRPVTKDRSRVPSRKNPRRVIKTVHLRVPKYTSNLANTVVSAS